MKKITRCVHIFPRFKNSNIIEDIREKYDPLFGCIEPHITVVFPFESSIDKTVLKNEIQNILQKERAFIISAQKFEAVESYGYYLFLNLDSGLKVKRISLQII